MSSKNIKLTPKHDLTPKCPYCEHDIDEVYFKDVVRHSALTSFRLLFCPHCLKVLGNSENLL